MSAGQTIHRALDPLVGILFFLRPHFGFLPEEVHVGQGISAFSCKPSFRLVFVTKNGGNGYGHDLNHCVPSAVSHG